MNVGYPYDFDGRGLTATADDEAHLRDLIAQVLFTAPGERVMRPDFGSGLLALTFEPSGPELAATTQFLVQGALQQWLGHLIAVEKVEVTANEGALTVDIRYVELRSQQTRQAVFTAAGVGP